MADPRPGFEEKERAHRRWLERGDLFLGVVVGLVMAVALVAFMPDVRTHLLGGTDRERTTVVDVRLGTRPGSSDRPVTTYDLAWRDADGTTHIATFRRSGPPRREVGETWDLWVSPDGSAVETESPLVTWAWLGLGLPLVSVLAGALSGWRQRVFGRTLQRDVARAAARRSRRS